MIKYRGIYSRKGCSNSIVGKANIGETLANRINIILNIKKDKN